MWFAEARRARALTLVTLPARDRADHRQRRALEAADRGNERRCPVGSGESSCAPRGRTSGAMSIARRILVSPLTRLLIAVALIVALQAAFGAFVRALHVAPTLLLSACAGALVTVLAFVVVGVLVERRHLPDLGIQPKRALRDTAVGFGIGAAFISSVIAILAVNGWYRATLSTDTARGVAESFLLFLFVGISEEVLFRGILFRIVEDGLGSWAAAALSAALFGAVHLANPGATWVAGLAIVIEAGLLLAALYIVTRSLALVIGVHWAWNFFEGSVFGAAVSGRATPSVLRPTSGGPPLFTGGDFGPEAGIVAVVVCGTAAAALLVHAAQEGKTLAPSWVRRRAPAHAA